MKKGKLKANPRTVHVHGIAVAGDSISIPRSRRARLLGASALAGDAFRSFAIAAGVVTALGTAPAFAQVGCQSDTSDLTAGGSCLAAAATGANSTAVGFNANATGTNATAYGNGAVANGNFATATG